MDASVWATSPLGVEVKRVICGFFVFVFVFSSRLCCPLRFQNSPQTRQWEGFLAFGNFFSFTTPSLGWIAIPNSFVSLFIFYILSYLLSKRMCCLLGDLVSSTSIQKLFCGIYSAFKWSFDKFVREKWSPHPIPLPSLTWLWVNFKMDGNWVNLIQMTIIFTTVGKHP